MSDGQVTDQAPAKLAGPPTGSLASLDEGMPMDVLYRRIGELEVERLILLDRNSKLELVIAQLTAQLQGGGP